MVGENLISPRLNLVVAKICVLLRLVAEYVNSPTRRNPAKATRVATARFRSSL